MAWKHLADKLKTELNDKRVMEGLSRQTQFASDFQSLMNVFKRRNSSPFDSHASDIFDKLNAACKIFQDGAHWQKGDISKGRYFYRVETLDSFLNKHQAYLHGDFSSDDNIILPLDMRNEDDFFTTIAGDYIDRGKGWQPLTRLTSTYHSYRNFSWWTNDYIFDVENFPDTFEGATLTHDNRWMLEFAFKVGIASDWLSSNMLFLRLDSEIDELSKKDICVPSIIDALLQPIFSPQASKPIPGWGKAFDLNATFKPEAREYVIKNIPVKGVEYFPVKLDQDTFDKINAAARLNEKMVRYLIDNI